MHVIQIVHDTLCKKGKSMARYFYRIIFCFFMCAGLLQAMELEKAPEAYFLVSSNGILQSSLYPWLFKHCKNKTSFLNMWESSPAAHHNCKTAMENARDLKNPITAYLQLANEGYSAEIIPLLTSDSNGTRYVSQFFITLKQVIIDDSDDEPSLFLD